MIFFAALPVVAVLVAPPVAPEEGCPSARQVTEAMQVRFPALLAPVELAGSGALRGDVLRSVLDVAADGTVVRFSLVDARGDTQLRRTLPAPVRGKLAMECLALADTVAAIVERYLGTIAYEASDSGDIAPAGDAVIADSARPAPPLATAVIQAAPRRALSLAVGVSWRSTTGGGPQQDGLEVRLGGQLDLTRASPRLAALLNVGAAPGITTPLPDGVRSATLRRFPARVGLLLELAAGPGFVEPVVQTGVDLIVLTSTASDRAPAGSLVRLSPVLEAGVGYRLRLAGRFFLRPGVAIGAALKRYDTGVQNDPRELPLATPWAYASFGIDTALVFQ